MRSTRMLMILVAVGLAVGSGGMAVEVSAGSGSEADTPSGSKAAVQAAAEAEVDTEAQTEERFEKIRQKGAKVSSNTRIAVDTALKAAVEEIERSVRDDVEATVVDRLAIEFGTSSGALKSEREASRARWGESVIAHTLHANARSDVNAAQLLRLRRTGTGWAQIAAGLGLKLSDVAPAVRAEGRVARGGSRPDGKVAVIRHEAGPNGGLVARP